ncbi:hypothetical protein [Amycolatopsis sp. NPDC051071]|uniref:hypothetical protein n=1 Tax=Amycolatopsis sp. NPDC051071 TaxID=3154637 RepID=UPI003439A8CF
MFVMVMNPLLPAEGGRRRGLLRAPGRAAGRPLPDGAADRGDRPAPGATRVVPSSAVCASCTSSSAWSSLACPEATLFRVPWVFCVLLWPLWAVLGADSAVSRLSCATERFAFATRSCFAAYALTTSPTPRRPAERSAHR